MRLADEFEEVGLQGGQILAVSPFAFFEVKSKMFFDPVELGQASFGKAPESLNAVDVSPALGKSLALVDAYMAVIAHIDQPVIPPPTIGHDHAGRVNFASDHPLESRRRTVGHDLGVDLSVTLKNAEDRLFEGSSSALARTWTSPHPGRAEVSLIGLHDPGQPLHLGLAMQENQPAEDAVEPVDGVAAEPKTKPFWRPQCQNKSTP